MNCPHMNFDANVDVSRITEGVGGPVVRWSADVRIACRDCGTPMRFIGLPAGLDLNSPTVSVDAQEGRFPIAPKGEVISELEGGPQGFSIRRYTRCVSDKLDRAEKAEARVAELEAELAEVKRGYDALDRNWSAIHEGAMGAIRKSLGNPDATVPEICAALEAARAALTGGERSAVERFRNERTFFEEFRSIHSVAISMWLRDTIVALIDRLAPPAPPAAPK
jgi:hypothetical protein